MKIRFVLLTMILVSCNEGNKYNVSSDESNNNNRTSLDHKNTYLNCPDENHPHMIDLGLPSGTIWSCCNVGASSPKDYGDFYAWGETKEKMKFYSNTYQFENVKIGPSISGTRYDVAHVKWGGKWRMPTAEEWEELIEDGACKWVEVNGMGGYIISGKKPGYKDRSIFLPASGSYLRMDNEFDLFGNKGDYWSSSRSTDNYYRPASGFFIDRFEYKKSVTSRHLPKSIRPVCP